MLASNTVRVILMALAIVPALQGCVKPPDSGCDGIGTGTQWDRSLHYGCKQAEKEREIEQRETEMKSTQINTDLDLWKTCNELNSHLQECVERFETSGEECAESFRNSDFFGDFEKCERSGLLIVPVR